jgi:16S rRNA U516 pseudouridylate synthase RsuA-like enzyme
MKFVSLSSIKIYEVEMDKPPTSQQIQQLASGVSITTALQRDSGLQWITAPTMPCQVSATEKLR